MAQNWTPKQANWVQSFSQECVNFMNSVDHLAELCNEFAQNGYGIGGTNALTDTVVQQGNFSGTGPLPAATALLVAEAEGVIAGTNMILSIAGQQGSGRGYLEMMRP